MPWTGSTFASRHNHSLRGERADHASRIANAVLKSGAPEGESIAIANKWAQRHKRADGGYSTDRPQISREDDAEILSRGRPKSNQTDLNMTPTPMIGAPPGSISSPHVRTLSTMPPPARFHYPTPAGRVQAACGGSIRRAPGGPAPPGVGPMQTAAPNVNAYGYVPVAQGADTLNIDLTSGAISPHGFSLPGLQGVADRGLPIGNPAYFGELNGQFLGRADGGVISHRAAGGPAPMSMGMAMPPWSRAEARGEGAHPSGLIPGQGGGRQDNIPMNLAQHSHVIPADVVSGWGQGNPEQGAANIEHAMRSGPFGTSLPKVPTHAARGMAMHTPRMARGGNAKGVRTLVSPKEMIISPADVARIGGGDYDRGHDWLDRFIVHSRKQIVRHIRSLPGPVQE